MNTIEPVYFQAKGSGLDLTEYQPRISGGSNAWDETHDYLLHWALEEKYKELSDFTLADEIKELIGGKDKIIED